MSTWEHIVQTLALHCRSYLRRISLLLFLLLQGMNAHGSESGAGAITSPLAKTRDFWVWDLNIMPPGFRRASATLRAEGKRSLIYVEDKYYGKEISPEFIQRLKLQLEEKMPSGSLEPDTGIISFEEKLFGSLPTKITRDDRLIVLFADLGKFKDTQFDGFFNAFDQMPDAEAFKEFGQHSNEANVIYLNGFRVSESYTVGVIAHELHHLLASTSGVERENWLSESLAEGAMLLTGYYGDQGHVNHFVENTWNISLVSPRYVQYGPQLLFSAFLLDSLPSAPGSAIGELTHMSQTGRDAVEKLFQERTQTPLSFDAIFNNFVSYVFDQSEQKALLPSSWQHGEGIQIPKITPYYVFPSASGELNGQIAPYSFLAVDLSQKLTPSIIVRVERTNPPSGNPGPCAQNASVLWKPISLERIALYAVGCDPGEKKDPIQFRLKILDQPSLLPPSPFNIFR